jgi:hypothetical protein
MIRVPSKVGIRVWQGKDEKEKSNALKGFYSDDVSGIELPFFVFVFVLEFQTILLLGSGFCDQKGVLRVAP